MKSHQPVVSSLSPGKTRFASHSQAVTWTGLSSKVRDEIIDLWHHPLIVQQSLKNVSCLTTLRLLIAPSLLSSQLDSHAKHCISELCQWLRGNGVRYELGFATEESEPNHPVKNSAQSGIHRIFLDIEMQ